MKREIKLLKHALKKGKEDPLMYSLEETRKLEAKLKQLTDCLLYTSDAADEP